jgi:hypothetical protein
VVAIGEAFGDFIRYFSRTSAEVQSNPHGTDASARVELTTAVVNAVAIPAILLLKSTLQFVYYSYGFQSI